jgi:signal transduction histidine kinase
MAYLFLNLIFLLAVSVILFLYFKNKKLNKKNLNLIKLLQNNESRKAAVETEKNHFAKIINSLDFGILAINQNDKIIAINKVAAKILGFEAKTLLNLPVSELKKENDDLKLFVHYLFLHDKIDDMGIELKNQRLSISILPERFGKLVTLKKPGHNLERAKTDFILSTMHQIRTAVTGGKWSLRMLLSGDFGQISEEQKDVVKRLDKRNEELVLFIDDLLKIIKTEQVNYNIKKHPESFEDIVFECVNLFKDKIKLKEIDFQVAKPKQRLSKILCDKGKIEWAVQNLIDNALKYTPQKGKINVLLKLSPKFVEFCIKDSGIGIPESEKNKIFQKFFRATNANKIEKNGTGLGLSIAKNIIEAHGGKIWFDSKEGQGSSFCFTLPINRVE